jgi:hypothetical protein
MDRTEVRSVGHCSALSERHDVVALVGARFAAPVADAAGCTDDGLVQLLA